MFIYNTYTSFMMNCFIFKSTKINVCTVIDLNIHKLLVYNVFKYKRHFKSKSVKQMLFGKLDQQICNYEYLTLIIF